MDLKLTSVLLRNIEPFLGYETRIWIFLPAPGPRGKTLKKADAHTRECLGAEPSLTQA